VRVLAIIHQSDAGLGVFADAIDAAGARIDEWYPARQANPPPELRGYGAVITLGGAMHADQEREHPWLRSEKELLGRLLDAGTPLLGVCLGGQLLAEAAGADVRRAGAPEIGWYDVHKSRAADDDSLLGPLPPRFRALEWHSYEFSLPPGATALARSECCLQAFRIGDAAWGIQFHAEVAPADLESWIDDYRSDPDAIASGLDPHALRAEVREAIAGWNEFGRDLVRRFMSVAAARS
jgi:GMP synthase-like glutamine amidotransferase